MGTFRYETFRSTELASLPRDKTLFFFSVGACEDHGPSLPIALDLYEAKTISERTAKILEDQGWTCVMMPTLPMAVDGNTARGALRVRPHVLRDYLVDTCHSLAKDGFKYFVVVSGNPAPKQLTTLEEAGLFLRKKHLRFGLFPNKNAPILVSASSVTLDSFEKSTSSFRMLPPEHGGKRDASIALVAAPDRVEVERLRATPSLEKTGKDAAYWGDPASADLLFAETLLTEKTLALSTKIRAAFEGVNAHRIFKSWYSLVPTNQSLFKIWVLVFALVVLLGAWVWFAVQNFMAGVTTQGTL